MKCEYDNIDYIYSKLSPDDFEKVRKLVYGIGIR